MKKTKAKGFTLIELIVVVAIFSMILFGAMQLMDPVSKIFQRTSNYEASAATVDNVKRYIEGSLRYADFVDVYECGELLCKADADVSAQINTFMNSYFKDACERDTDTTSKYRIIDVYVMKINNKENGRITEEVHHVNTHGEYVATVPGEEASTFTRRDAINATYFQNTKLDIQLGDDVRLNKFTMRIINYRDSAQPGEAHSDTSSETIASLSLVNAVNNSNTNYYKLEEKDGKQEVTLGKVINPFSCTTTGDKDGILIIYAFEHQR